MARDNLAGRVFGMLTVTGVDYLRNRDVYWNCTCLCRRVHSVRAQHLRSGAISACPQCSADLAFINRLRKKEAALNGKG